MEIVTNTFAIYGFSVNFSPGKTETVLFFNGEGAIKVRRALAAMGNTIKFHTKSGVKDLRVVSAYKHLGTKIVSSAEILPEVKTRMAQMREAMVPTRKQILERHEVEPEKRATIATATLLTKGAYQTSAWPALRPKELAVFHTGVIEIMRPIAVTATGPPPVYQKGEEYPKGRMVNDDQVLAVTKSMAPAAMLRLTRQVLLVRLCRKPPTGVMRVLYAARNAKRSWLRAVEDDIRMLTRTVVFQELAGCTVARWCDSIRHGPAAFKRKLKAACSDPLVSSRASWASTRHLQSIGLDWNCELCANSYKSRQALAVLSAIKHKEKHAAHWLVDDTFCPVCLTEFWTRHKVLEHLQEKAPKCFAFLSLTTPRLPAARVEELDELARQQARCMKITGSRRATALRPAMRLAGPLPNVPLEELAEGRHHLLGVGRRWLN